MDNRPIDEESLEPVGPYVGLRPYEECHRHIFFGREEERDILIDKLIANKLTLLFAATGVGKSSLLRAGVLPALKHKKKEGLDVVYYCDWVSDPLVHLKKETVEVLQAQNKIAGDYPLYREDEDISLKKFFRLAAAFASEPLVVILDQFEEFFQYRRYKENFTEFIEEFSECVNDRERQVVFLVSMREDFALELNVFKKYLPTILFENYYRLEKLTTKKAGEAIVKPVDPLGFQYEEKLLETLLTDLAKREEEALVGAVPAALAKDTPAYVEPPYLQIVCSRLWEIDRDNPGKKIRLEIYEQMGCARGFVDSYFHEVMDRFTLSEKKIASSAFDLLVTPRGTKMAYTAKDLGDRTRTGENDLENVLEKLRKSRILRSQKREGAIWYELYHDIFSTIINRWNEKFKIQQRIKWASFIFAMAILAFLVLFTIYNIISNTTSHYLRLSVKETISDRIEVYQGKLKSTDIFHLHEFQAEAPFERDRVEPDKLFVEKQIGDFEQLNRELIGNLPLIERIFAYWDAGEINKAFELIKNSISENDMNQSRQVIGLLPGFFSKKSYHLLKEQLGKSYSIYLRKEIVNALATMPPTLIIEDFIDLLKDESVEVRKIAFSALGQIGSDHAVESLLKMLNESEPYVRCNAADALGDLGSEKAVEPLIGLLMDQDIYVRRRAADALGRLGSEKAVIPLIGRLKDPDKYVRRRAVYALGRLGSKKAVEPLIGLLKDSDIYVRRLAIGALGVLGSEQAVPALLQLLKGPDTNVRPRVAEALGVLGSDQIIIPLLQLLKNPDSDIRCRTAYALGLLDCEQAVPDLLQLFKDPNPDVRRSAVDALGRLGSEQAVPDFLKLLKDKNYYVRSSVAEALGLIGSDQTFQELTQLFKDKNVYVRSTAFEVLSGLGSEIAIDPLLQLLKDTAWNVRRSAAKALGSLGSDKAVAPLLGLLKDQSEQVRNCSADALGGLGSELAVPPLLQLLKDQDSDVRSRVAEILVRLECMQAMPALLQMLRDQDKNVRRRAAETLSVLGSEQAVAILLQLLKDQYSYVRIHAADALGRFGSLKTIGSFASLIYDIVPDMRKIAILNLGKLSAREKAASIKKRYTDKNEKPSVKLAAAATLLKWGDESGLEYLKETVKQDNVNRKIEVAEVLGEAPSKKGNSILIEMLADENIRVKETVISSLGKARNKSSLPSLHKLIDYHNVRIRAAAVGTLAEIASPESIETLKKVAKNNGEPMSIRFNAIKGLTRIQHQDALQFLIELLDNENSIICYKTIMTIGKNPPAAALPNDLINRLKARLNDKLKVLEERKARWRKIRDENTDSYNEEKLKDWNKRLEEVEPNEPLEFELAFALSRIDPFHEGTDLLGHPFANVREGAWMGLGKSRDVSLIETLYKQRKHSDVPWFIHAAYRAIDHILIGIEAFGDQEELNRLESLYKKLSAEEGNDFHEGVKTRMEWTIERLKELESKNEKVKSKNEK